jgi:hypothetical protein
VKRLLHNDVELRVEMSMEPGSLAHFPG